MGSLEGKTPGTQGPQSVSTRLRRIAELARKAPEMAITTLAHHIDVDFLREAYRRTRKDAAAGIDGQTARQYGERLEENLRSLLERFKSGRYRAPPVRRVNIPKAKGQTRPIGIPTFEDKVLQRAVTMVMEAVYEQDFLPCSYGFRPGRSAHTALQALWHEAMKMRGGWVYEVDVRGFFDTLDHGHLRSFLDQRVRDGVIRRAIGKWLKAGVLEAGAVRHLETGTPQGGVISPLLANIYLHEVLDKWFERDVIPRLKGRAKLIRYADDFVIVFSSKDDALRVMEVLPKRFAKYGLTLHPEKTRLVPFQRPRQGTCPRQGDKPGTFQLLGFTHYWGLSRKGTWVVLRKTMSERLSRTLKAIKAWVRRNRHAPVAVQQEMLNAKLRGHYQYYGITGNYRALNFVYQTVQTLWYKWLNRRSRRKDLGWERFHLLKQRFPLAAPRIAHSVYRCAANPSS